MRRAPRFRRGAQCTAPAHSTLLLCTPCQRSVEICTTPGSGAKACYNMPVVGQGSCCGAYNISSWLQAGGTHIDTCVWADLAFRACTLPKSHPHTRRPLPLPLARSVDYGSQPTIAAAIQASGIPRSQLWITSKVRPWAYAL